MKLIFQLDLYVYPSMEKRLDDVRQFLTTTGLESYLSVYDTVAWNKNGSQIKTFDNVEELSTLIEEEGHGIYELKTTLSEPTAKFRMLNKGFGVIIEWPILTEESLTSLHNYCVEVIKNVADRFTERYEIGGDSSVMVRDIAVQKIYPHISLDSFGENHLVDLLWSIKAPWLDEEAEESDAVLLEKTRSLPEDIPVYINGKLLMILWLGGNIKSIETSLHLREEWYNKHFNLPSEY